MGVFSLLRNQPKGIKLYQTWRSHIQSGSLGNLHLVFNSNACVTWHGPPCISQTCITPPCIAPPCIAPSCIAPLCIAPLCVCVCISKFSSYLRGNTILFHDKDQSGNVLVNSWSRRDVLSTMRTESIQILHVKAGTADQRLVFNVDLTKHHTGKLLLF